MFWENLIETLHVMMRSPMGSVLCGWNFRTLCRLAYHQAGMEDEQEAELIERFHEQCWADMYLPRILTTRI